MDKTPAIFPKGINFYKAKEGVPEWVKGQIVINMKELLAFVSEQNLENMVRIDMKKSKEGKLYLQLSTWKPTATPRTDKPDISKETVDEQGYPMPF